MKTIWIINEYAGSKEHGMVYRHYYMAKELIKSGYKVYIISASYSHTFNKLPKISGDFTLEDIEGINYLWVKVPKYVGAHSKKRFLKWLVFALKLFFLPRCKIDKPDFVLVSPTAPFSILPAYYFKRKFHAKLIYEVRDIWPLSIIELGGFSPKHPVIRLMQWCEDFAYKKSDKVVSVLPGADQHMEERGLSKDKFVYIPNGFLMDEMDLNGELGKETVEKIPKNKFIVGYAGTVGFANSVIDFVKSAKLLREYKDILFLIVGDGLQRAELIKMKDVDQLDNVIFLDPIPKLQIQSLLKHFKVCFIGLKKEPIFRFGVSPNKLFDYMFSAKPIIYAVESGNDPVHDASCGISVEAENPNAIADAILKLYRMPKEERDRLGQNGREYVIKNHEYGKLAEKLISLF